MIPVDIESKDKDSTTSKTRKRNVRRGNEPWNSISAKNDPVNAKMYNKSVADSARNNEVVENYRSAKASIMDSSRDYVSAKENYKSMKA